MGCRHRRADGGRALAAKRAAPLAPCVPFGLARPRLASADRRSLLLGTALASTLLISGLTAPITASAQTTADCSSAGPTPILITVPLTDPVVCVNTETRVGTAALNAIEITVTAGIDLANSGHLEGYDGIYAQTLGSDKDIYIVNTGPIDVIRDGVRAVTGTNGGDIEIVNSGTVTANDRDGIVAVTQADNSRIEIYNLIGGDITVARHGILAYNNQDNVAQSPILIENDAAIDAGQDGIKAFTGRNTEASPDSGITIRNSGRIEAGLDGLHADTYGPGSSILIENSGDLYTGSNGINADTGFNTNAADSGITIRNYGRIVADRDGIEADTYGPRGAIRIDNSGTIDAGDDGIVAGTSGLGSFIRIDNSGRISGGQDGIGAETGSDNSYIRAVNSGTITSRDEAIEADTAGDNSSVTIINDGSVTSREQEGLSSDTAGSNSAITIVNRGAVGAGIVGIDAHSKGTNSAVIIQNSGDIFAGAAGIAAATVGADSALRIENSGTVFGSNAGIRVSSNTGTKILNTGDISAGSQFAIGVFVGGAEIYNAGTITGFVRLNADDIFINQAGGVFEARQTSDFDAYGTGGTDLFRNEAGGTVHVGGTSKSESAAFVNLERFENAGLISLQDGHVGDSFEISNTVGQRNLTFAASGNSTLAVDAFLGGPGSKSDTFTVNGDIFGKTAVSVFNTNPGPGLFGATIPVIYAESDNVNAGAFYLAQPIDTGFFDYDLFFRPTGSGVFELRSFLGGGAYVLPQLTTAAQDLWHQGSSTWFDRTADLRVLLAGGAAPAAYDPNPEYADRAPPGGNLTPAVWARGSGGRLGRDTSTSTTAFGRTYDYTLDRDLDAVDWQMGLDLGRSDLLSPGDVLVFGLLGGFVHGDLDYDHLARQFDFSGGQAGAYATYLKGGLFVDTLFNAQIMQLETNTLGFPGSLDATTLGLRTDTGYRFGSFSGGAFVEPLATLSVTWADIEGFSLGGNTVSFDDDAQLRGRLGLRLGTQTHAWADTVMEPFVTGSVWGNLSGDINQATLTSSGTTFRLIDEPADVWGEVSAGVNFFNPGANTAVFAKLDVTFGDDMDGIGGKAGMRVAW